MMPQKRNAFLLEHVQGRAGAALGAFTAAATAMHATPFSISVAVGSEGVKPLWPALEQVTVAVVLARLCVAGAEPNPARMHQRAADGFTAATELATRLAVDGGLSFRRAHHVVGETVTEAAARGQSLAQAAGPLLRAHGLSDDPDRLDPASVAAASAYGGGPAERSLRRALAEARAQWSASARTLAARVRRWREGERLLRDAVAALAAPEPASIPLRGVVRAPALTRCP
jgi:argininosuccinate lyase